MNESPDTDPEAAFLARFQPSGPSARLHARLLAARPAISAPPVPERKILRFLPRVAAAAAVFALTGAVTRQWLERPVQTAAAAPAGPAAAQPEQSRQQLLGVRDLGLTRDAQRRPVRLMHATWLDDQIYTGRDGRQAVREASVREEILPVVLTTY